MKLKKLFPLILLILTPFLIADVGPKPTADFEIIYQVDPNPKLTGYDLYLCSSVDCTDAHRLEDAGPQRFECDQQVCTSMAYGYGEFMYITFDFANGKSLSSNIFTKKHFNAEYQIFVMESELMVTETGGSNMGSFGPLGGLAIGIPLIFLCCGCLVTVLIIVTVVLVLRNKRQKE